MSNAAPIRVADFVNSIGVNTHLPYTDGAYANVNVVLKAMNYLGLVHVRDWVINDKPYPGDEGQLSYPVAAQAGLKFNMNVISGSDIPHTTAILADFIRKYPGSVVSIEGPNEVNNWPVTFNGLTGDQGALAFQSALFAAVNANPVLMNIPVYNLTSYPDLVGDADFSNLHSYPARGDQPYATLAHGVAAHRGLMPGKPIAITEAGYYTLPNGGGWGGVDELTQAKLTLNLVFDASKLGVERTYLYQLLDAYADPQGLDPEKHFGLFDINNAPKPAATALHNLTTILSDPGAGRGSFQTSPLSYSLVGDAAGVSSLTLQKSSGTTELVLWAEPDIWDEVARKPIAAPGQTFGLQFDTQYSTVNIYDPLSGTTPVKTFSGISYLQLTVVDHPLIIELIGPASGLQLHGHSGDDVLAGQNGPDTIYGLEGNDRITGGAGADTLNGNAGADVLAGGDGADNLYGGRDDDLLFGGTGDDLMTGGLGVDTLWGEDGDDALYGNPGDDVLHGGAGQDRLFGERDNDILWGGDSHDALYGGAGNDQLNGEAGHDVLAGNVGDDVLNGGLGNDQLDGGEGYDVARFSGVRAAYTIRVLNGVTHVSGPDGDDVLVNIEALAFADLVAAAPTAEGWAI